MAETYSAGIVTAYGAAVRGGYTGTYEQWCQDMANLGDNVAEVRTKAAQAAQSAGNAAGSATAAAGSAGSAAGSASEAASSAGNAAESATAAAESATAAAGSATNAASSATAASASATAAGNAQTAAETAQGKAEDAQEAAEQAQSDAEAAAQSVSQSAAQISQNTSDISDLKSAVNDPVTGLDTKAPAIIDTASGSVVNFSDGADNMPLKKLVVNIEPVQSGSGDPSPDNVRPISGWTGANVTRTGFNVWDEDWESGGYSEQTGAKISNASYIRTKNLIQCFGGKKYYAFSKNSQQVVFYYYDSNLNYIGFAVVTNAEVVVPSNARWIGCRILVDIVPYKVGDICINLSDPAKNGIYEPGHVVTIPISWQSEAGTVYDGTLDVTSGVLTVTDANIASYNGETLPGEWISDRDVYSVGATPTIGAQVVYKLATPLEYTLTAQQLTTLLGTNNILADCSSVSVDYPADTKLYINNKIAAAIAAALNA